jgi:hypothetical protein
MQKRGSAGRACAEWRWAREPALEMKVGVILSEAKDLQFRFEAN